MSSRPKKAAPNDPARVVPPCLHDLRLKVRSQLARRIRRDRFDPALSAKIDAVQALIDGESSV